MANPELKIYLVISRFGHGPLLNGQCNEMDLYYEGLNILLSTVLSVYALIVSFKSLSQPYTIIDFFSSLKLVTFLF